MSGRVNNILDLHRFMSRTSEISFLSQWILGQIININFLASLFIHTSFIKRLFAFEISLNTILEVGDLCSYNIILQAIQSFQIKHWGN